MPPIIPGTIDTTLLQRAMEESWPMRSAHIGTRALVGEVLAATVAGESRLVVVVTDHAVVAIVPAL